MAEETLVESLVTDSIELIKQLDKQGDNPTNVLWYFYSDAEEWRLLIAGPTFDKLLPKSEDEAYQRLAMAIKAARLSTLTIADVKLIRTDDAVIKATKVVLKTPMSAVVRAHFRDNTFNGIFVKEMLLMRAA